MDDWRPALPLDQMDYLDGFLSCIYDSDLPDGAWFQAQVDLIAEHWDDVENLDAHECFMQYLEWKNPSKEEDEDGYQESRKEKSSKQEGSSKEEDRS